LGKAAFVFGTPAKVAPTPKGIDAVTGLLPGHDVGIFAVATLIN